MLGAGLDAVFRAALAAGRRVRRETGVGRGAVSTASVCVTLARQALGELSGRRALVVGAGPMASSAARALARNGAGEIVVANRTPAAARRLAQDVRGTGVGLSAVSGELARADLVVSCTSAPEPVLRRADAARALQGRDGRPLVCIDLALPRDIEPAVASLEGIVLLDIDDLRHAAAANRAGRAIEARRAEAIVAAEVARCLRPGRVERPRARLASAA